MDGPRLLACRQSKLTKRVALLAALTNVCLAASLLGQSQPAATEQRAYTVHHIDLQQAAQRVRAVLGNDGESVVFADQSSNRLLVQAPSQQLASVGDLLSKLDRPASAPEEGFLRAYAVTPDRREQAERWSREFQAPEGSQVAYDDRTNQLIVMGPGDLHRYVTSQLQSSAAAAEVPASTGSPRFLPTPQAQVPSPSPANATRLTLNHSTGESLHQRLEKLLSRPLPVTTSSTGQRLQFRAEMAPGVGVAIDADRDSGDIVLSGPADQIAAWTSVLRAMDAPATASSMTQVVATKPSTDVQVRQTLKVIQAQAGHTQANARPQGQLVSMLFQPQEGQQGAVVQPPADALQPADDEEDTVAAVPFTGGQGEGETDPAEGALLGPVQVQFVEGLDIILIRGNRRDVERVMEIINRIEQVSAETVPAIEVLPLNHVNSQSMAQLLARVYTEVLGPRTGSLSITPLAKPNSLLLVGRPENVNTAVELIKRIDVPVEPTTRFEVFPLRHAVAGDVKQIIDAFLLRQEQEGEEDPIPVALAPNALVVADFRTNSVIVAASPRDMAEVAALIREIDVDRGVAVDEVRIFPLQNTLATEMAEVLRTAVLAREEGEAQQGAGALSARVSGLRFVTIDPENQRELESGVLTNIRIAADSQANSLVVTAPSESMELIAALIEQLDQAPDAEAEIKVFTIVNGDAVSLAAMLTDLFGTGEDDEQIAGLGAGDNALVRLQFSVDERTNSIIAAGTQADLAVVYAILLQLDASDTRQRRTEVYRLKNSPAEDVALALNEWLRTEREAEAAADLAISPFEQIEREVVIVPELVSNSLIVSATPRYFEEIAALVEELDERPAMVMIQVLIAEVRLNDTDEFGVELGLQDSILFDRSVLDLQNFQTITTTVNEQSPGGATVTTEQETIVNAPLIPGFNFNNQPLGNNASDQALATAGTVAAQGLSNFALNRINPELGFGGFVFAASSNSVSALLRALQESRRLEVLSRPQITALDNQQAIVRVGQRVPRVQSTNITQFGQQNSVVYEDVGIILQVQPRVSPDGMVVMTVQAEKSQVGSEAEGIPIFTGLDGNVVRAPRIDQTVAYSTVAAASGQTIVMSGLLTKESFDVHRRVPILAEIPLVGDLFRYDSVAEERTELLIILTPRVIRSEADAEMIKQVESARMSWVLCDVVKLHGPSGLRSRCDVWTESDSESVYPTHVPGEGEIAPTPPVEGPYMDLEPQSPEVSTEVELVPTEQGSSREGGSENAAVTPANYVMPTPAPTRMPPPTKGN